MEELLSCVRIINSVLQISLECPLLESIVKGVEVKPTWLTLVHLFVLKINIVE